MKTKVYCKSCKYFCFDYSGTALCFHPNAKQGISIVDNWYNKEEKEIRLHPSDINKNNNCKWYEKG